MKTSALRLRSERGSVLITALLMSAAIAITLGSYYSLCLNTYRLSLSSYHMTTAMNIAEAGLEQALWSINQYTAHGNTNAFDGWTPANGTDVKRTFDQGFNLGQNTAGAAQVYIKNCTGAVSSPKVTAHAIVTLADGRRIEKWIEVDLYKRSRFATGLVAKRELTFDGNNVTIDSWDSNPDTDNDGDHDSNDAIVPYSAGIAHDKGSIGSVLVTSTIAVQNADVWGYAAVGGGSTSAISVGPQGLVGPYGTPVGVKDPNRIATDFVANLEPMPQPDSTGSYTSLNTNATLGTGTYSYTSINLTNKTLTIAECSNVTLLITASSGSSAIGIGGGSGALVIGKNATLTIYTAGDIKIAGNGISNGYIDPVTHAYVNNPPSSLQIWGTSTSIAPDRLQSIDVTGNGSLSGVVFAPNATVKISGGGTATSGDVYGSIIGDSVTVSGNTAFHYDESLARAASGSPYGITLWRELLSSADRNAIVGEF